MYIYVCVYVIHTHTHTHTHTQEHYSVLRKKEILPFVTTWMDLEGIMQTVYNITYMWNLKRA